MLLTTQWRRKPAGADTVCLRILSTVGAPAACTREAAAGGADQEVRLPRPHRLSGGRQEAEDAEAPSEVLLWPDAGAVRERWDLPRDYPMVAPDYAEKRSALAKSIGLGRNPAAALPEVARKTAPD